LVVFRQNVAVDRFRPEDAPSCGPRANHRMTIEWLGSYSKAQWEMPQRGYLFAFLVFLLNPMDSRQLFVANVV